MANDENEDLFKEAKEYSINEELKNKMESRIASVPDKEKNELLTVIKERVEEGETQWDLLKKMIDGSLTERFIRVISEMPDKDFARNYIKLLEHFKPKITRVEEGDTETPDNIINIQTVIINAKGEKEIIKLEDIPKQLKQ